MGSACCRRSPSSASRSFLRAISASASEGTFGLGLGVGVGVAVGVGVGVGLGVGLGVGVGTIDATPRIAASAESPPSPRSTCR